MSLPLLTLLLPYILLADAGACIHRILHFLILPSNDIDQLTQQSKGIPRHQVDRYLGSRRYRHGRKPRKPCLSSFVVSRAALAGVRPSRVNRHIRIHPVHKLSSIGFLPFWFQLFFSKYQLFMLC
jgi:hypothetical protein